jgi:hypothetical protein
MIVAAFAPLLAKEKSRSKAIELVRRRRAKPPPRVLLLVIFLSFFRLRRRRNKKSSYLARRGELKRSRYVKNPFFPYSFSLAFPLSRFSKRERERQREIFPKKKSGKEELREERERERIKSFILAMMCIYQSGVFFFERERESVKSSQLDVQKISKSIHLLGSFIVTIEEAKPKSKKIRKVRSVLEGHPSLLFKSKTKKKPRFRRNTLSLPFPQN